MLVGICLGGIGLQWKRSVGTHQKSSRFQHHFKLILKSIFNKVFAFLALQTKTRKKCGMHAQTSKKSGNAVPVRSCPTTSLGWQLPWVAVVLGGSCVGGDCPR